MHSASLYTERLWEADIGSLIIGAGVLYGNALAETINGMYSTEMIRHLGLWRIVNHGEYKTLN